MEDNNINTVHPKKKIWKFWLVMGVVFVGFGAILMRLFQIQILEADNFKKRAVSQHRTKIELNSNRGDIWDRNKTMIATTFRSYTVAADPKVVKEPRIIASALQKVTGGNADVYIRKMKKKNDRFVELAEKLYPYQIEELKKIDDPGLILISEPQRLFEYGSDLGQVIGLTNTENLGISGLELRWNTELTGESGYIIMNKDGLRRLHPSADLPVSPAKDGNSLMLTIDMNIQEIVEYELKQGVLRTGAASGTIVAIKPSTGEILAMASYPNFDPNTRKGFNAENRRIRAITDSYEPGSTFKIITAAAALEEGTVTENSVYNGYKGYYAGKGFRIRDVHAIDEATFKEAVRHSSNIIFAQVANEMSGNVFYKYIRDFGFGIPLGIDLPGEVSGKVKKPSEFSGVTKRFMGHGYELMVTPLQMVNAYATIANNGNMMKPYIVKSVLNSKGKTLKEFKPQMIRRVISDSTAKKLTKLFTAVVDSGTGTAARIEGLKITGKTGTAQQVVAGRYSKKYYTGSFAGYFPAEDPEIAMIVIIDKPQGAYYGGSTAAPIFKNITAKLISSRTFNNTHITAVKEDTVKVPYLKGMYIDSAEDLLDNLDLDFSTEGDGEIIVSQSHEPGILISDDDEIQVQLVDIKDFDDLKEFDLTGLPASRAIKILFALKVKPLVKGSGLINDYYFKMNKDSSMVCIMKCR